MSGTDRDPNRLWWFVSVQGIIWYTVGTVAIASLIASIVVVWAH